MHVQTVPACIDTKRLLLANIFKTFFCATEAGKMLGDIFTSKKKKDVSNYVVNRIFDLFCI